MARSLGRVLELAQALDDPDCAGALRSAVLEAPARARLRRRLRRRDACLVRAGRGRGSAADDVRTGVIRLAAAQPQRAVDGVRDRCLRRAVARGRSILAARVAAAGRGAGRALRPEHGVHHAGSQRLSGARGHARGAGRIQPAQPAYGAGRARAGCASSRERSRCRRWRAIASIWRSTNGTTPRPRPTRRRWACAR